MQTGLKDYKGNPVSMGSPEMEVDYLAAKEEIRKSLGYGISITSGMRTEEENEEAAKKYGFTSGKEHVRGTALDVVVNGITAFKPGGHNPTEEGLKYAQEIQGIMAKHGFKWAGEKDIVHFSYDQSSTGTVIGVDRLNTEQQNLSPTQAFFNKFDVLGKNLTNINQLPNKKISKMAEFLVAIGKGKLISIG